MGNSHLSPKKFVLFTYLWAHGVSSACQESLCEVSTPTAVDWNNFLRDICSRQLLANPIQLGGPGRHVMIGIERILKKYALYIDESLMARRKYHVGHLVPERWVFGLFDAEQRIGVLEFVDDRIQATLFPLIQKYVRGGTIINSDSAAMYVNHHTQQSHLVNIPTIPMVPYQHIWVNHTQNFVDPLVLIRFCLLFINPLLKLRLEHVLTWWRDSGATPNKRIKR